MPGPKPGALPLGDTPMKNGRNSSDFVMICQGSEIAKFKIVWRYFGVILGY